MAEIKRYQPDVVYARYGGGRDHVLHEHTNGDYVLHSDHEAAIKAAVDAALLEAVKIAAKETPAAIKTAVTAEREACVKIAFEHKGAVAYEIGIAIRARGAAHETN